MPEQNEPNKATGTDATGSAVDTFKALLEAEDTPPQDPPADQADDDQDDDQQADDDQPVDDDTQDEDQEPDSDADTPDDQSDDQDDGADADDAGEPAEDVYEVNINGETVEVTLEELTSGYSRQSDYSRKTQALAEERKVFEGETEAVKQERARYAELLDKLETTIEASLPGEMSAEEWATLRKENPTEYAAKKADLQEVKERLEKVRTEKVRVAQKRQEEMARELEQHLGSEREKLVNAVPTWSDGEVMNREQEQLVVYAKTQGFTPDELNAVTDHRAIVMLRKAMLYDKLQGKKQTVRKKARRAPVMKPGAAKQPKPKATQAQRSREQLRKSGSVDSAAAYFFDSLVEETN